MYLYGSNTSYLTYKEAELDYLCTTAGIGSMETCNQLASEGNLWIFTSDVVTPECCSCCTYEQGCGPLTQTWMEDASFEGQTTVGGQAANMWKIEGNEANYYYDSVDARIPLLLNNSGNQLFYYDAASYTTDFDTAMFNVPAMCSGAPLCPGFCAKIRSM